MLIGKIKIEPAGMLGDADTDRLLGSIKLRARFEQIERRPDRRRARCGPGGLVIAAQVQGGARRSLTKPQPGCLTMCEQSSERCSSFSAGFAGQCL
jgi:hypothetical protein